MEFIGVYWNWWPLGSRWGAQGQPWEQQRAGSSVGRSSRKQVAQLGRLRQLSLWQEPTSWAGQCHTTVSPRLYLNIQSVCECVCVGVRVHVRDRPAAMEGHSSGLSGRHAPTCRPHRGRVEQDLGTGPGGQRALRPQAGDPRWHGQWLFKEPCVLPPVRRRWACACPPGWRLMLTSSPTWRCWVLCGLQVLQRPHLRKRFT